MKMEDLFYPCERCQKACELVALLDAELGNNDLFITGSVQHPNTSEMVQGLLRNGFVVGCSKCNDKRWLLKPEAAPIIRFIKDMLKEEMQEGMKPEPIPY